MASREDMRKVEMALFGTASVFIGFLIVGMQPQTSSPSQRPTCAADGGSGDQPLAPQATAFMLMISFSFALLSWCSLAVLRLQHHHTAGELARAVSDLSLGFAAVSGIAAVDSMIGLGHFSGSRLQTAGGGWTCLVVIVAAYVIAVCKVWKATRSPATSTARTQQVQSVDVTPRTTPFPADGPAAAGPTNYAGPSSSSRSVSLRSRPPPADDVGSITFSYQRAIAPRLDVGEQLPLMDEYTLLHVRFVLYVSSHSPGQVFIRQRHTFSSSLWIMDPDANSEADDKS